MTRAKRNMSPEDIKLQKIIATKIKCIRQAQNISTKKASALLGCSLVQYHNYENGVASIYVTHLVKLAEYFKVDIKDLMSTQPISLSIPCNFDS